MELQLAGAKKKKIELAEDVFGGEFNEALIHQVVTAFLAGGRAGTQAQKTRSEVRGGGIKPWKQKGSGRARAGTIRSPIWRKGGVAFAAKPRSYAQKVNKKMYKGAMRSIFAELIRAERVTVVESFTVDSPKTRNLLSQLAELKIEKDILIITESVEENLYLAARNLNHVSVRDAIAIDPVSLVGSQQILVTVEALKQIEEMLK